MLARVSLHFINPLFKIVEREGGCLDEIIQQAGLGDVVLDKNRDEIPLLHLCQLWRTAIDYFSTPLLPFAAGQLVHPSDYNLIGNLAMHSPTLGEALSAIGRYRYLFNGGFHSRLHFAGADAIYEFVGPRELPADLARPIVELDFAANIQMIRFLIDHNEADKPLTPKCVGFQFEPLADVKHYEALFGCPVFFNQETNTIITSQQLLQEEIHEPNPELKKLIIEQLERTKSELSRRESFASRVESFLHARLPALPDMLETAQEFYISERTLKRRLQDEDRNFKDICDQLRKEYALDILQRGYTPISEVAFDLGFSSVSTFHRAFKRWTGQTPKSFIEGRRPSGRARKSEPADL